MLRPVLVLCLAACAAVPAHAGRILYATAATPGRVDGFCLTGNGSLVPQRRVSIDTNGQYPRRLLVSADNKVLYVAENDRVEFFAIGDGGGLRRMGHVPETPQLSNPRDMALSPDGRTLYFPERRRDAIYAFPLAADGLPASLSYTSCLKGPVVSDWERLLVANGLLYVSSSRNTGSVSTYPLAADGRFETVCVERDADGNVVTDDKGNVEVVRDPVTFQALICGDPNCPDQSCEPVSGPEACDGNADEVSQPSSQRVKLNGATKMLLDGSRLFVEQKFRQRIVAFDLQAEGTFDSAPDAKGHDNRQPQVGHTKARIRYTDLVMAQGTTGTSIIGTQFFDGRVDGYRLGNGLTLPRQPTRRTTDDVFSSPVRLLVSGDVLYVGGGQIDRVQAYRLSEDGLPRDDQPFSVTDEERGSFPNDIAIAEIPGACN